MTSGVWPSQGQRHGRHRRGATGAAWTPVVRPTDTGPAHAQRDGAVAFRPTDTEAGRPAYRSEVLTRRPGWPVDDLVPSVPYARTADATPRHAAPVAWPTEQDVARIPAPLRAERQRKTEKPEPPKRKTVSADMYFETAPIGPVLPREAVVHVLPEVAETGLRKFDLGNVPASVTPPRSWRKAAWFAVGTSAAVVLGLAVASAELMGRPVDKEPMIDALPAFPTGPLTLEQLPNERTTETPPPSTSHPAPKTTTTPVRRSDPPRDTVIGGTTRDTTTDPATTTTGGTGTGTGTTTPTTTTEPPPPTRRTVGAQPVTPTDPKQMGDLTESYFRQVVEDPAAAHAMTTGSMAREGEEGIEQRYEGVDRVEVQDITIDRNQAVTRSQVKVVRADGSSTIENRQLTFTWGGDPKITDDSVTQ